MRMQRLARNGGTAELLRWLSGRADGWAGIAGSDGTVLSASGTVAPHAPQPPDVPRLVADGVRALAERGALRTPTTPARTPPCSSPCTPTTGAPPPSSPSSRPAPWPPGSPRCWPTC
ncbi:hypothetical protein SMICM304S_02176 [Streptomyces microflavus]